jgi:type IV secretory pathway VirB10-like protein
MEKTFLATAIQVALVSAFVVNNSGVTYGFEGLRILSARERETDDPQELIIDKDQAFRLQDYLKLQDPFIEVVIQPFQGGAVDSDGESTGPSADELAAAAAQAEAEKLAAAQAEADKLAAEKAEAEKLAAAQAEADKLAAEKAEAEKLAAAQAEADKLAAEKAEAEKLAAAQAEADKQAAAKKPAKA